MCLILQEHWFTGNTLGNTLKKLEANGVMIHSAMP